jgi:hypothetical protein
MRPLRQSSTASDLDAWVFAYDAYAALAGLPPRNAATIAVQNGGGIRDQGGSNFLPPGPISRLDLLNMLPFDNTIVVVSNVAAAELESILEHSAASLPAQGGQFLQVGGLRVDYDPARTATVTLPDGSITVPCGPRQAVGYEEAAREYLQGNPEFPLVGALRNVPALRAVPDRERGADRHQRPLSFAISLSSRPASRSTASPSAPAGGQARREPSSTPSMRNGGARLSKSPVSGCPSGSK